MHLDVVKLKNFYFQTQLGRYAANALSDQASALWQDLRGRSLVGFGFAVPVFDSLASQCARVVNLMPEQQGVAAWPEEGPNASVLASEAQWPIPTGFADRVVLLHGLETSENPSMLLDECWRVLAPGGRALFIVPNRAGLWARRDATPFGYGRPYSAGQLESQLIKHRFDPECQRAALFAPPSSRRFWLRAGPRLEQFGSRSSIGFASGALLIEATKRIYAPMRPGLSEAVRRKLKALEGIASPEPRPAAGRSVAMQPTVGNNAPVGGNAAAPMNRNIEK